MLRASLIIEKHPMSGDPSIQPGNTFPSTGWALIRAVQDRAHPEHHPALDRFALLYQRPVFCFLRTLGCPAQEAEDLVQEFFVWMLEGKWIQKADPQRGNFRTFLRMHLRSFIADRMSTRRLPRQKQFERQLASLDAISREQGQPYEPSAGDTPDQAFDRAFARSVVQTVREAYRNICETEKRQEWYAIFTATYPDDIGARALSQQALAEQFGKTRDEVRGILDRTERRFRRLLSNELRDHGGSETDIDAEVTELLRLLQMTT